MPVVLSLRFPWGRYHATPWGRSVNEAEPEWPPSPWRVLRALYSAWKTRCPELPSEVVHRLFMSLSAAPSFQLPEHGVAHTRHYMPDISFGTDKVFDPFVVIDRNERVLVRWSAELDNESRAALARLVEELAYLGRAESVCVAQLQDEHEAGAGGLWLDPVEQGGSMLAPTVAVLGAELPVNLDHLVLTTAEVRRRRLPIPPGTRWVHYQPSPPADAAPTPAKRRLTRPAVVRYAIEAPAAPALTAALAVGEILRAAALSRFGRQFYGRVSPVLAGKSSDGTPHVGQHTHAHYLATDLDRDGLIDTLFVWAPGGLDEEDVQALASLQRLTGFRHVTEFRPMRLAVEAIGATADAAPELAAVSRTWRSTTPFAPVRHLNPRLARRLDDGAGGPTHDEPWELFVKDEVRRELAYRLGNETVERADPQVRLLVGESRLDGSRFDWLSFRRHRVTGSRGRERLEDARRAVGVEVSFAHDMTGPIALGALSHFGLGLFAPA